MASQRSILDPFEFGADFERLMNENIQKLEHERKQQSRRRSIDFSGDLSRFLLLTYGKFCRVDLYGGHQYHGAIKPDQTSKSPTEPKWTVLLQFLYAVCTLRTIIRIYYQYQYDISMLQYDRLVQKHGGGAGLRATKVGASFLWNSPPVSNNRTLLETYSKRIQAASLGLDSVGALLRDLSFGIQFFDLFQVLMIFMLYIQPQVYFKYFQTFDFSIMRCMLDLKGELRTCNALIRHQMNRFVESSRNYTCTALLMMEHRQHALGHPVCQTDLNQLDQPLVSAVCDVPDLAHPNDHLIIRFECNRRAYRQRARSAAAPPTHAEQPKTSYQLLVRDKLLDHFYTIKLIESMALNGALMPSNRTGTWVNTIAHYNFLADLVFVFYSILIQMVIFLTIPSLANIDYHINFCDFLSLIDMIVLALVVVITSLFYTGLILSSSLDQVHLVQQLKRNMVAVISTNTRRYLTSRRLDECAQQLDQELTQGTLVESKQKAAIEDLRRCSLLAASQHTQMDADLLNILLQYKIFVAQFIPTKRSYGFVSLLASTLMMLLPLIGCVHVPYIDRSIKIYVSFLSLLCALVADVAILVPIAYLYARTAELYKLLSSLLAHTVATSLQQHLDSIQDASRPSRRAKEQREDKLQSGQMEDMSKIFDLASTEMHKIYNGHSIWLLRKELNHPDCLVDQFVTFVSGVRLNYSNLLKVHFWLGLLMQTMFFGTSSPGTQQEFFGSLMVDPLGLL